MKAHESIILADVSDGNKVVAALREAVDEVLNATSLRELIQIRYNSRTISTFIPRMALRWPANRYIPREIIERLRLGLDVPTHRERRSSRTPVK
jgi:hypothetical protein